MVVLRVFGDGRSFGRVDPRRCFAFFVREPLGSLIGEPTAAARRARARLARLALAQRSFSVGELLTGVRALPVGRRRAGLLEAIEATLRAFADAVPAYDEAAARHYARLQELRRCSRAGCWACRHGW